MPALDQSVSNGPDRVHVLLDKDESTLPETVEIVVDDLFQPRIRCEDPIDSGILVDTRER